MQSHVLSSAMAPLIMYSAPIKVVSKPDQVQKRRKKREEEAKRKAASVALATGLVSPAAASLAAVPLFGHPLTDEMVKALQNVERQQHAQQELLNRVIELLGGRPPNIVLTQSELLALESLGIEPLEMGDPQEPVSWDNNNNSGSDSEEASSSEQRKSTSCACVCVLTRATEPRLEHLRGGAAPVAAPTPLPAAAERPPEKVLDLESAFALMMSSYETMSAEQRTEKIRNVVRQTQISRDSVSEIHDLFYAEGLQRALSDDANGDSIMMEPIGRHGASAGEACTCEDCPHKKELARIENFYREVFSLY